MSEGKSGRYWTIVPFVTFRLEVIETFVNVVQRQLSYLNLALIANDGPRRAGWQYSMDLSENE
jgi:hypothetical protein